MKSAELSLVGGRLGLRSGYGSHVRVRDRRLVIYCLFGGARSRQTCI
jgi:hypothetical protein